MIYTVRPFIITPYYQSYSAYTWSVTVILSRREFTRIDSRYIIFLVLSDRTKWNMAGKLKRMSQDWKTLAWATNECLLDNMHYWVQYCEPSEDGIIPWDVHWIPTLNGAWWNPGYVGIFRMTWRWLTRRPSRPIDADCRKMTREICVNGVAPQVRNLKCYFDTQSVVHCLSLSFYLQGRTSDSGERKELASGQ